MNLFILLLLAPDSVVYSIPESAVNFAHDSASHRVIPCETCHTNTSASIRASDHHRPVEKVCGTCHESWLVPTEGQCKQCHVGYPSLGQTPSMDRDKLPKPKRARSTTSVLHFSHRLHAERGIQCSQCHTVKAGHAPTMPSMADCVDCHREKKAPTRCDACHPTRPDGILRTDLPSGQLKPSSRVLPQAQHDLAFERNHGAAARLSPTLCSSCHRDNRCADCHTGNRRPILTHPADYIHQHAVDARLNRPNCSGCHQPQRFCVNCHTRSGVAMGPGTELRGRPRGPRRFHPPGFVSEPGSPKSANHHGQAARRNLRTCVSCHQETDCVRCHTTGAPNSIRANPHPPHFRCGRLLDVNLRGCLKCHRDRVSIIKACERR